MNNPTPSEDRGVGTCSNEYPGIFAVHISELALVIFVSKTPIILKGNSGVKMNLFQTNGQLVRVPFSLLVLSSGLSSCICFG